MQTLQDWHLALGVALLVAFDFLILLVYSIVEGTRGNLAAMLEPNRENIRDITGVSACN